MLQLVFESSMTFNAVWGAESYLRAHGYAFGSSCCPMPTAVIKGNQDVRIAKWKNLTVAERLNIAAKMEGIDRSGMREGPILLSFYDDHKPQLDYAKEGLVFTMRQL